MKNLWNAILNYLSLLVGKINWTTKRVISESDRELIRQRLKDNYYIILTRHDGHLSSHVISLLHFFMTGRMGYYGHALMNVENEVNSDADFKFIEATGQGVHYSTFDEVFDNQCSSVVLMSPTHMLLSHWTAVLDKARTELGKPYDTLFELADDRALSCVELIRTALQNQPTYATDFAQFESMIANSKNLDPQMFYECPDFSKVWEVRN